jgi:uncharacterized Zn finger protein
MVRARNISGFSVSLSMIFGQSPKITYNCGACGHTNSARMSLEALQRGKPYVVCAKCGEVNDTNLKLTSV